MTTKQLNERLNKGEPSPPTRRKWWCGSAISTEKCACCGRALSGVTVFIDGRIPSLGSWGLCCQSCWQWHGPKDQNGKPMLGTGIGQKYRLEEFAGIVRWWKVESQKERELREAQDARMVDNDGADSAEEIIHAGNTMAE